MGVIEQRGNRRNHNNMKRKNDNEENEDNSLSYPPKITHHNYPMLVETFKDPDTQLETVIVVLCLPGGAQNVKTELNDDGTMLLVKFGWPKVLLNVEDLFQEELADKSITLDHPKVIAAQKEIEKACIGDGSIPESLIKLNLPIKVQTSSASWTSSEMKHDDGTHLVLAELAGYVQN